MVDPLRVDVPSSPLPPPEVVGAATASQIRQQLDQASAAARPQLASDLLGGLDDTALAAMAGGEDGRAALQALDEALAEAPPAQRGVEADRARLAAAQADGTPPSGDRAALLLDLGQTALDIVGIFEPTPFADLTNTGISIGRGNWLDAGLSALGVIPYLGDLGKLGKLPRLAGTIDNAIAIARNDPGFAQQVRPLLQRIDGALDNVPLDSLPASARETVESMQRRLDEFLGGAGRFPEFVDGARHVDPVTGRTVIDAKPGATGGWNASINADRLEPDALYRTDTGYLYHTDAGGRVVRVEGNLQLGDGPRNTYQQQVSGREDRLPDDQGGHLIASIFDGPGEQMNLVPQNGNLNMGAWKRMENAWAEALKADLDVQVRIDPVYGGDSLRPTRFDVSYQIEGQPPTTRTFQNRPGG
ncbi:DNA/RNA non-specific endonuclease [Luteimonas sp. RD2P54]|uniref:DNA/RNA non-specific endonuclease n=1 Tax=Luteimonas endophytica TaxID=3042023 RepID=A0ABT6JD47_9GAMM|nr:DNA/RNA non-specific endonuclease [Luteimonas endophytica]MDH5824747.1 DNA/RNA non-specific endonuclease [Luteimonas endophytica]